MNYIGVCVNKRIITFVTAAVLLFALTGVNAAVTGTENITLSSNSANVLPGGAVAVNYSLSLINGYYSFGTNLYVVASKQLSSKNVSVILTKSSGNPPINGVMHMFLGAATIPGIYNVTLAGNSTNVYVNSGTFVVDVLGPTTSSTSSSSSITQSTVLSSTLQSSTVPQTTYITTVSPSVQQNTSNSNSDLVYYLIGIVIVIVALLYRIFTKRFKIVSKTSDERMKKPKG